MCVRLRAKRREVVAKQSGRAAGETNEARPYVRTPSCVHTEPGEARQSRGAKGNAKLQLVSSASAAT